jgi:hypothetical protein
MNTPETKDHLQEEFNWNIPNRRTINRNVEVFDDSRVYCQEDYAQSLYYQMAESLKGVKFF